MTTTTEKRTVQNECIEEHEGNWLVIAGPGTGKTYTISERIKKMLENGISPDSILCLTFTDTGVREMKNRVCDKYNIDVFTYHGFCKKIMDDYKEEFDTDSMTVITDMYKRTLISECITEKVPVKYNNEKGNPYSFVIDILDGVEEIKGNRIKDKKTFDFNIENNPMWKPRLKELKILAEQEKTAAEQKHYEDIARKENEIRILESKPSLTAKQAEQLEKAKKQLKKYQNAPIKLPTTKDVKNLQLKIDRMEELWEYYQMYSEKMQNLKYIDFDDMINKVLDKFEDEDSTLLETVAKKYKYVIVDEYQDTNTAQNGIVLSLASQCQNIFVVGDDDQIVYTFQGAHLDTIDNYYNELLPNVRCFDKNYRSTQPILDVAMKLAELQDTSFNSFMADKDTELKADYESLITTPSNLRFNMNDENENKISKVLISSKKEIQPFSKPVELYRFDEYDDERDYIVKKVIKIKKEIDEYNKTETEAAEKENREPKLKKLSEIAILTRANDELIDYADYLKANKIPVELTKGKNIFTITPVNLLISYMQALTNPERYKDKILSCLLARPFHIHPKDYEGIIKIRTHYSTLVGCIEGYIQQCKDEDKHPQDEQKLKDFVKTFNDLQQFIYSEKYQLSVFEIGQKTGIFDEYFGDNDINKLENIKGFKKLIDTANVYFEVNKNQDSSFSLFVDYLSNTMESGSEILTDKEDEPLNAVQLSTYHSSKGREFDYVFLPNLTKDKLDSLRIDKDIIPAEPKLNKTYEDVLREKHQAFFLDTVKLLYVGITRARHSLTLTYTGTETEEDKYQGLSWFIRTLAENPFNKKGERVLTEPPIEKFYFDYYSPQFEYDYKTEFKEYIQQNIPNKFAITPLNHYRNCPKQYFYEKIMKIEVKSGNKDSLSYGTAIHSAFEETIKSVMTKDKNRKRAYLSNNDAHKAFCSKLKTLEITDPNGAKSSAAEKLFGENGFYNDFIDLVKAENIKEDAEYTKEPMLTPDATGKYEIYAEVPLYYDITNELKDMGFDTGEKNIFLTGFVDRIDKNPDGTYTVYDYKTTESCEDIAPGNDYFYQMVFYKYVLEKQFPGIKVTKTCFILPIEKDGNHFIDVSAKFDKTKAKYDNRTTNYQYSEQQILSAIQGILSGEFDVSEKTNCGNCSYKYICKDRKTL